MLQKGLTNALGNTTSYTFDQADRLVRTTVPLSGSGVSLVTAVTTYTLDAAGEMSDMLERADCYDAAGPGFLPVRR